MSSLNEICSSAKEASYLLADLTTDRKNNFLFSLANRIISQTNTIIEYNQKDISQAKTNGLSDALIDRLQLNETRIKALAESVKEVALLPDPVGEICNGSLRPNGLRVYQERVPLGVVMVIFESRPNVIVDISSLSLKSGNVAILKGGKEALTTNNILISLIKDTLKAEGLPTSAVHLISTSDREEIKKYLQQTAYIDVVVPRGGEKLINWVSEYSRIPVIKHDKGLCHLFIDNYLIDKRFDEKAYIHMANTVTVNSKVQRPGVCNSIETLLVHEDYPYIEKLLTTLSKEGVEVRLEPKLYKQFPQYLQAQEKDWSTEYLDLILSVKTISNTEQAVQWINHYGSHHTDVIVSNNHHNISYFQKHVDSSCVIINASSRFNDGGMLGLGTEVGISNQKIHVRGPMGIRDLTCLKYQVQGNGQIRT